MDKFEQWFTNQDFYTNMRFIHGDALFIKDGDIYRVLPVQMAWEVWQSRQAEVDQLERKLKLSEALGSNQSEQLQNSLQQRDAAKQRVRLFKAEIDEKDKRIEKVLSELESLHNKKWAEWKEQADMHSQGEANAYEHAMRILEGALRGNNA